MLRKRQPLRFSIAGLLEVVWQRRRIKFASLVAVWPGCSLSVLSCNLKELEEGGLIRGRWVSCPGRQRYRYWRITPKGREILRKLMPIRDYWELLQPREMRGLAIAEGILQKIVRRHTELFGKDGPKLPAFDYWHKKGPRDPEPAA